MTAVPGSKKREPLDIAIRAEVMPGSSGGIGTAVRVLVESLGRLEDGPERYTVVVGSADQLDWWKPYAHPNQRFVVRDLGAPGTSAYERLKNVIKPALPAVRRVRRALFGERGPQRQWPEVPISDGFYESLGCEVLHIPTQAFELCALPTVYNPHDLQQLHYPQFWTAAEIAWRETIYPAGCHFANTVVVGSQWAKDDVATQYRIPPGKIQIVPEAAPTDLYPEPSAAELAEVRQRYDLRQPFAFYPAVTWQHKNHIRLLEALAYLRDERGLEIPLICTGSQKTDHWETIRTRIETLRLTNQVRFLGFVPEAHLRALYRLAQFMVEPSLFEASSLPVFEAWAEGVPVAVSDVTALPEQVKDAGLLFDPLDVQAIAAAIERMTTDGQLRERLVRLGSERLGQFDLERTAKAYRAVYRRAARRALDEEDRWLLQCNWMRDSFERQEFSTKS
jgi:glycosyltransferase involved in cell wall biosynthesis